VVSNEALSLLLLRNSTVIVLSDAVYLDDLTIWISSSYDFIVVTKMSDCHNVLCFLRFRATFIARTSPSESQENCVHSQNVNFLGFYVDRMLNDRVHALNP
jgi:hypothetical protein